MSSSQPHGVGNGKNGRSRGGGSCHARVESGGRVGVVVVRVMVVMVVKVVVVALVQTHRHVVAPPAALTCSKPKHRPCVDEKGRGGTKGM